MMYDAVVIGGGPSGATCANELAMEGYKVALIDRAGRIKPCGGAIPPCLIREFDIPDAQLVAKINTARMISPTQRYVDIPIENGFVGMVDREHFDAFLRERAEQSGADRFTGTFLRIERDGEADAASRPVEDHSARVIYKDHATGEETTLETRLVVGADGARSKVAASQIPDRGKDRYVVAYHEIIEAPAVDDQDAAYAPNRCDVIYDGAISPDFYGWIFPHGRHASVGLGTEDRSVDLKSRTADLRTVSGLEGCKTIRREGAPIPLKPLKRWDNGRDVVVAGDAAGVVAPSSGEGIFYAMMGGRVACEAVHATLQSGDVRHLKLARKRFMRDHKAVFKILGAMQDAYYRSDMRRERFVSLCHDEDVQRLTFEAYMNKKLVGARPLAHIKIGLKNVAHLLGLVRPEKV